MQRGATAIGLLQALVAVVCLLSAPGRTVATMFDVTADPSYNTNAPTGSLVNSGWQFEGRFGVFLGTTVAPHYFLTARHIGGDTNTPFILDGTNYHPTAFHDDPAPGSDLRLWQVAEHLPRYAPTYTGSNEAGATIVVFGRGTQRGDAVVTSNLTNGWLWGTTDSVTRWGSNRVENIATVEGAPYLYATFDHGAGPDECHLSSGDSGGAAFVLQDGVWQLAGIHYAVDAYFNTTNTGAGFSAAIYDEYGLYYGSDTNWALITNHVPSGFYSSQVSAHYNWLTNTIPDFDSDANGIPDWWEKQYSGSIHGLAATNDPDRDGMNNLAEWISRTDPTNAASFLRVDAMQWSNSVATLTFQGWSNRLYRVSSHDGPLTTGNWQTAVSNAFTGLDGPTPWSDADLQNVTSRFYRLDVMLPP